LAIGLLFLAKTPPAIESKGDSMRLSRLSLSVAGFVLAAAAFAHADEMELFLLFESSTSTSGTSEIVNAGSVDLFNPSLGTLTSIDFFVFGDAIFNNSPAFFIGLGLDPDSPFPLSITGSASMGGLFHFSAIGTLSSSSYLNMFEGTGTTDLFLSFNSEVTSALGEGDVLYNYTPAAPPPVPEPSSLALLGTGILAFAGAARHKFFTV
jgi:hypothetical protein